MLKDAALLTLDIMLNAIENGFILKDGSSFNVAFHKGRMTFFDVLSIDSYHEGQAWEGFQQFSTEFLYPLLLKSHKNLDFQEIVRGTMGTISPQMIRGFFNWSDVFKKGVFKHIILGAFFHKSSNVAASTVKDKIKISKMALQELLRSLRKLILKLSYMPTSIWSGYAFNNTYDTSDTGRKEEFIKKFATSLKRDSTIIDLGCNTGKFSEIVAQNHNVISCDLDSSCIDCVYQRSQQSDLKTILPVVLNLMNPSPNLGWENKERSSFLTRIKTDGFLSLALIHHLCITHNLPLERFASFLASVGSSGVVEWVDKNDPMVKFMLRNRDDIFYDYTWDNFQRVLLKFFKIENIDIINDGTRKLCHVIAK